MVLLLFTTLKFYVQDPICLELKKGYPGIICCLKRAQTDALKEECRLYEQRCREHCSRVFGETNVEVTKDEAYYSALRAKSFEKIKGEFVLFYVNLNC